jgi:hypothetical protein
MYDHILYLNFNFFTQTDHPKEINGIVRQGAPLNLVGLNEGWKRSILIIDFFSQKGLQG